MSENTSLSDEVNVAQENLRLSANTVAKLNNELKIVCNETEELKHRLREALEANKKLSDQNSELNVQINEYNALNTVLKTLKDKVGMLTSENMGLGEEVRNAQ